MSGDETTLHGGAVAIARRALVIIGPAGAGKSTLALELIALGAALVADDRVTLRRRGARLFAASPDPPPARIEARGIGLLRLETLAQAEVAALLDLGEAEGERLPPRRRRAVLGLEIPLWRRPDPLSPAALIVALRAGGPEDPDAPV